MAQSKEKNILTKAIRRVDPLMRDILATASHVEHYKYSKQVSDWCKSKVEGSLFLYSRRGLPRYNLIIMNPLNIQNIIEPVIKEHEYEILKPFLVYKNYYKTTCCIWFSNEEEFSKMINVIGLLLSEEEKATTYVSGDFMKPWEAKNIYVSPRIGVPTFPQCTIKLPDLKLFSNNDSSSNTSAKTVKPVEQIDLTTIELSPITGCIKKQYPATKHGGAYGKYRNQTGTSPNTDFGKYKSRRALHFTPLKNDLIYNRTSSACISTGVIDPKLSSNSGSSPNISAKPAEQIDLLTCELSPITRCIKKQYPTTKHGGAYDKDRNLRSTCPNTNFGKYNSRKGLHFTPSKNYSTYNRTSSTCISTGVIDPKLLSNSGSGLEISAETAKPVEQIDLTTNELSPSTGCIKKQYAATKHSGAYGKYRNQRSTFSNTNFGRYKSQKGLHLTLSKNDSTYNRTSSTYSSTGVIDPKLFYNSDSIPNISTESAKPAEQINLTTSELSPNTGCIKKQYPATKHGGAYGKYRNQTGTSPNTDFSKHKGRGALHLISSKNDYTYNRTSSTCISTGVIDPKVFSNYSSSPDISAQTAKPVKQIDLTTCDFSPITGCIKKQYPATKHRGPYGKGRNQRGTFPNTNFGKYENRRALYFQPSKYYSTYGRTSFTCRSTGGTKETQITAVNVKETCASNEELQDPRTPQSHSQSQPQSELQSQAQSQPDSLRQYQFPPRRQIPSRLQFSRSQFSPRSQNYSQPQFSCSQSTQWSEFPRGRQFCSQQQFYSSAWRQLPPHFQFSQQLQSPELRQSPEPPRSPRNSQPSSQSQSPEPAQAPTMSDLSVCELQSQSNGNEEDIKNAVDCITKAFASVLEDPDVLIKIHKAYAQSVNDAINTTLKRGSKS